MTLPTAIPGRLWGVDTSVAQGPPTYLGALRDAGCAFHFARAHSGNAADSVYHTTAAEAERLEVPFGAYGVIRDRGPVDAEKQARAFLDAVKGTRRELPDVLDWELPANPKAMTRAQAVGNQKAFAARPHQQARPGPRGKGRLNEPGLAGVAMGKSPCRWARAGRMTVARMRGGSGRAPRGGGRTQPTEPARWRDRRRAGARVVGRGIQAWRGHTAARRRRSRRPARRRLRRRVGS
jgi:hypothetical protein